VGVLVPPRRLAGLLALCCCFLLIGASAQASAANTASTPRGARHHVKRLRTRAHVNQRSGHRRGAGSRQRTGGTPAGTSRARPPHRHARPAPAAGKEQAARTSVAAQASAVIAGVLATPCQNTEIMPTAGNVPLARTAVLCLINRVRAEHDIAPLSTTAALDSAAEGHAAELIADDYFAHVSPSGETPVDRIRTTGYIPNSSVGYVIGENLAWGTYTLATPQAIVAAWVASPGHLANILESQYHDTGIGITPAVPQSLGEGNPGATYAQEFGVIIR
jgi:uncharacterized protein YkwD